MNEIVIVGLVILAIVGGLIWFKSRQSAGSVEKQLSQLGESYSVFTDIRLPSSSGMCQVDHLVTSPFGIFVIHLVRGQGVLSGDLDDQEWQLGKDTIYNPVWTNRRNVNALESHLGALLYIPIVGVTQAKLKGDLGPAVAPVSNLAKKITSYKAVKIVEERLGEVNSMLKKTR